MIRYILRCLLTFGAPLPSPLPPVPEVVWLRRIKREIIVTARNPDDACHLALQRWCDRQRMSVVVGPHYVSPNNDLPYNPDHFPFGLPEVAFDLCINKVSEVDDPLTRFTPVSLTVLRIKESK